MPGGLHGKPLQQRGRDREVADRDDTDAGRPGRGVNFLNVGIGEPGAADDHVPMGRNRRQHVPLHRGRAGVVHEHIGRHHQRFVDGARDRELAEPLPTAAMRHGRDEVEIRGGLDRGGQRLPYPSSRARQAHADHRHRFRWLTYSSIVRGFTPNRSAFSRHVGNAAMWVAL